MKWLPRKRRLRWPFWTSTVITVVVLAAAVDAIVRIPSMPSKHAGVTSIFAMGALVFSIPWLITSLVLFVRAPRERCPRCGTETCSCKQVTTAPVIILTRSNAPGIRLPPEANRPDLHVGVIDGAKARTTQSALRAFASALRFPSYFGENFEALHECLCDLNDTIAEPNIMLVIENAQDFCAENGANLAIFARIIAEAQVVDRTLVVVFIAADTTPPICEGILDRLVVV